MKRLCMAVLMAVVMMPTAQAVTMAEDLATTIRLRGYDCGRQVSNISEQQDAQGNKIVRHLPERHPLPDYRYSGRAYAGSAAELVLTGPAEP